MARKVVVSRDNPLAYVKAAAACIDAGDDAVFSAFDAAETALEDESPEAAELFAAFCRLLDQRGIVVVDEQMSPAEKAEEKAYDDYVAKHPISNRGRLWGS